MLISPAEPCAEEIVQVLDLKISALFNRPNVLGQCIMKSEII